MPLIRIDSVIDGYFLATLDRFYVCDWPECETWSRLDEPETVPDLEAGDFGVKWVGVGRRNARKECRYYLCEHHATMSESQLELRRAAWFDADRDDLFRDILKAAYEIK